MTKRTLPAAAGFTQGRQVLATVSPRALKSWNPGLMAAAGDGQGGSNSISILDVIGADWYGEGVTPRGIAAALRNMQGQDVTVNINSPGGNFFDGLAIYNLLREHDGAVTVKVLGMAASAASVIAMAGDSIQVARAGFLMIHNTWIVAQGDKTDLREAADWLEPFDAAAVDIYAARSGQKPAAIVAMLDAETWLGGAAAVAKGFADELLPSDAVADDPKNAVRGEGLRAERTADNIGRLAGVPRSEMRELLQALKAMPGAGQEDDKPGAVESESLSGLLAELRAK